MKLFKAVQFPAREERVHVGTTCDLCGQEINPDSYDAEKVEIRHRSGVQYPDGGSGEEVEVDMCGDCFDSKLVPWLREQGADPKPVEWGW